MDHLLVLLVEVFHHQIQTRDLSMTTLMGTEMMLKILILCGKILPVTSHLVLTDNLPPSHSYLRVLVDRVDTTQGAQGALARCFLNTHFMKYYDM